MDIEIKNIGAIGDGKTLNTVVIQKAIDDCCQNGGGRVIISCGTYMTGKLIMKSNVDLHIASSGVLLGSANYEDYPETENVTHIIDSKLLPRMRNACLIFAHECENISITGSGKIDCNGEKFVVRRTDENIHIWKYERIKKPTPPRAVFFVGCKNVKVEDITMVNQPAGWSYWIHDCDYVTFDKVKIDANVNYPNNDGIHINCSRNVTISNCSISCGDDCIVVRANSVSLKENKVCEKVVVTNCTLTSYASGIRIGWINDGIIRNCTFSNLVMTSTSIGITIFLPYKIPDRENNMTTNGPGTSDIGREETLVENIAFNNVIMDRAYNYPIVFNIDDHKSVLCRGIQNIYFSNVHSRGPQLPFLKGRENCHIKNIYMSDCSFEVTDFSEFDGEEYFDSVYQDAPRIHTPIVLEHIDGLHINNTDFRVI